MAVTLGTYLVISITEKFLQFLHFCDFLCTICKIFAVVFPGVRKTLNNCIIPASCFFGASETCVLITVSPPDCPHLSLGEIAVWEDKGWLGTVSSSVPTMV